MIWLILGATLFGYLLGSIPFGLVLARLAGYGDIREIGSGNIGATNVLRTGNKPLALATLLLDAGKAGLAGLIVWWAAFKFYSGVEIEIINDFLGCQTEAPRNPDQCAQLGSAPPINPEVYYRSYILGLVAAGAAFIGHCFPVWLKFKGGKGVATFFGTLAAMGWPVALIAGTSWLLTAVIFRYSSLGALVAAIVAPIAAYMLDNTPLAILAAILGILIFIRHRENISRLMAGTESKIGDKKED